MTEIALVRIGRFIRPHGLKGEILVHSFTEDPLAVGSYGPVYALSPETPNFLLEEKLPTPFSFHNVRHGSQSASVLVSIEGFTTRTHVETFLEKPLDIFIPRTQLNDNQLGEEEFFHADLIGLDVHNEHGVRIGHVIALHNFGAGDILEIERALGEQNPPSTTPLISKSKKNLPPTFMVPFRHDFVPDVDLESHRLTVIYDDNTETSLHEKEPRL